MHTTTVQDLDALRNPIRGTAQITPDGMIIFGIHADGTPARLLLRQPGHNARHIAIVGDCGSGKTVLLRSILDAAGTAGLDVQVIDARADAWGGVLAAAGRPTAGSIAAARTVLAEQYDLARTRLANPDPYQRPTRLLVIDDLPELTHDAGVAERLRLLAPIAGRAGIVIVTASQSVTIGAYGDDLTRAVLTRAPVLLHISSPLTGAGIGAGNIPPLPTPLPGIGYLPHQRHDVPFRAWLPCSN